MNRTPTPARVAIPLLALAAGAAFAAPARGADPKPPSSELDWCAAVVTDPLRRWSDTGACFQPYPLAELASSADVVMMEGPELPEGSEAQAAATGDPCVDAPTLAAHARYLRELRALARARERAPFVTVKTRFDLVGPRLAERPGFDARFLLRTARPWSEVLGFFAADRSPDCRSGGCRLAEPDPAAPGGDPYGIGALRARIDASASPGASGSLVYYLSRGSPGQRTYHATNVVANLGDPRYRSWRVAEARRAIALGGYDAVMLNQKFHQYRPARGRGVSHWIGSPAAPDVTGLNRLGDTLWTAPPLAYGYPEYVAGWSALASDLRRAAVPYAVSISLAPWRGDRYDDPASPVNESALIREAAGGASLVLLDWPVRKRGKDFASVRASLEKKGVRVVPVDGSCGQPGARLGGAARDARR